MNILQVCNPILVRLLICMMDNDIEEEEVKLFYSHTMVSTEICLFGYLVAKYNVF